MQPNFKRYLLILKFACTLPVCLDSVCDWRHFRIGSDQQVRGERAFEVPAPY